MPQMTDAQRASLNMWCRYSAQCLNEAGLDMRMVLMAKAVDVWWTGPSFKEVMWKPVMEVMTTHESTMQMDTTEPSAVYDVLTRHFAQKMGVALPVWPDRFSQAEEHHATEGK